MPDRLAQFRDVLALYRRHGWSLARVLMTPATLAGLAHAGAAKASATDANVVGASAAEAASDGAAAAHAFEGVAASESDVDAMWLSRTSAGGREAWELRLISDPPYALFELFEPDELEEDREDVRREMEARLVEYAGGGGRAGGGEAETG